MLDCGLDMGSAMNFLPLPLVPSQKLNSLNSWMPRDPDSQLEGVSKQKDSLNTYQHLKLFIGIERMLEQSVC